MPVIGPSAALAAMSGASGQRTDPYQAFNFFIEIEGILAGGFSECSGLLIETEVHEYREGGVNDYVHRFVGATKSPVLTLRRGLTPIDTLWLWYQDVMEGTITRRNGTIYLLDKQQIPVIWWNFKEAVPVKWTGPELRADSANVAFVSIELAHRGLSRPLSEQGGALAGALAGGMLGGGGIGGLF